MKLGTVIGRVTLSETVAPVKGARWLMVNPMTRDDYLEWEDRDRGLSPEPSLVVYDNLGAGLGDRIGYVEGREAASPLDSRAPIDAIHAVMVDQIFYSPAR